MRSPFSSVPSAQIKRSVFDLSYDKKFTADFSWLYPVMCDELVPGDTFKIGASNVVRFNPLVAPVLHEITVSCHYFFVPYRILDRNWEAFITGGQDGNYLTPLPTWPRDAVSSIPNGYDPARGIELWDAMGFPIDIPVTNYNDPATLKPIDYPRRAYYSIWAYYYWDENISNPQPWINPDTLEFDVTGLPDTQSSLMQRAWSKDYFTSALPFQQRGTSPALPISGTVPLYLHTNNVGEPGSPAARFGGGQRWNHWPNIGLNLALWSDQIIAGADWADFVNSGFAQSAGASGGQVFHFAAPYPAGTQAQGFVGVYDGTPISSVDFSNAVTFNVSDMRLAFQIQKWMERNARSGVRYTEFLRAHFSVAPRDERLQRPEYIGGCKSKVVISEVLQTSQTTTQSPQANMAGHGINVTGDYVGTYRATEFGLIMGLMSIMPVPAYEDRLDRQWIKPTRFDFYFPEFANLSEQGIYNAELRYNASPNDANIFGFQGRYDELRFKHNMVAGMMRQSVSNGFSYWHCGRHFAPGTTPGLNEAFITGGFNEATGAKRILAVPSQPAFLVDWCNHIKAIRPLPIQSVPGLIDHH